MEPVIFLLFVLLLITTYRLLVFDNKKRRIAKYIDLLPGPKKYPIFGTSFELMRAPRDSNNVKILFFSNILKLVFRILGRLKKSCENIRTIV